jgi:single-strand DNA-binding protein
VSNNTYQKCIFVGHLGRDPEGRDTGSGKPMATFPLAVEGPRRDDDGQAETLWLDVAAFNKTAEICQQYLAKGSKVLVEGKLNPPRTFDRRDGGVGVALSLWADRVQFLDGRRRDGGADGEPAVGASDDIPF